MNSGCCETAYACEFLYAREASAADVVFVVVVVLEEDTAWLPCACACDAELPLTPGWLRRVPCSCDALPLGACEMDEGRGRLAGTLGFVRGFVGRAPKH